MRGFRIGDFGLGIRACVQGQGIVHPALSPPAPLPRERGAGFVVGLVLAVIAVPAFAVDEADLARRQADQRRARAMTREMVS